jgi:uncharacterized RDD family membrane protein YckC
LPFDGPVPPGRTPLISGRLTSISTPAPARAWRRLAAFAIDLLVLTPILGLLSWVWVRLFDVALPSAALPLYDYLVQLHLRGDPLVVGGLLFAAAVAGFYFLIAHLLWSTTVGMRFLGLVVVNSRGENPGAGACVARILGSGLSAAYFGLGFIWIAFDSRRQGLHDKISDTLVIQRKTR